MNIKSLILVSGGLDSALAVKILQEQNIKITALYFKSYFFNENNAKESMRDLKTPLKIIDISERHLEMVKKPKHGYGSFMNPCIDCHLMMLKKAKEIMIKENYDFVASGEVLGQRPMSQNKNILRFLEKESGLERYLLRPLSAQLLPITIPEQKGLIKREKLLDISGRSRKRQIKLTEKYGIKKFSSPAGGCLLTDPEFSKRLKQFFEKTQVFKADSDYTLPQCNGNDIELLKFGRHFWQDDFKIVIGRDKNENHIVKKLAFENDILIEMKNYPGPVTLVRNYGKKNIEMQDFASQIEKAKELTKYYSTKAREQCDVKFEITKMCLIASNHLKRYKKHVG